MKGTELEEASTRTCSRTAHAPLSKLDAVHGPRLQLVQGRHHRVFHLKTHKTTHIQHSQEPRGLYTTDDSQCKCNFKILKYRVSTVDPGPRIGPTN